MDEAERLEYLLMIMPNARFARVGNVDAAEPSPDRKTPGFDYVSLYDHRISSQVWPIGGRLMMVSNGFVSSHTYNIALSWLWHPAGQRRRRALRHNYKKFFAEAVVDQRNILIGRALLIETLMYEQGVNRPLFDAVERSDSLGTLARGVSAFCTEVVSRHELGHYLLHQDRQSFLADLHQFFDGDLARLYAEVSTALGPKPSDEYLCDGVACHVALTEQNESFGRGDVLRLLIFTFCVFADLASLQRSAHYTADTDADDDAQIDLSSEKRPKRAFSYSIGRDEAFDARRDAIIGLLVAQAERDGIDLYSGDGAFPMPCDPRDELRDAFDTCLDHDEHEPVGLTGTDLERRQLCQLLAESLHDHPKGAEFLLWRSKVFSQGGEKVDP